MARGVPDPVLTVAVSPIADVHVRLGDHPHDRPAQRDVHVALLAKSANGYVSSFGELTGLQLDRAPKRLEVVPYVVGQVKTQPGEPGNSLINATDPDGSLGV